MAMLHRRVDIPLWGVLASLAVLAVAVTAAAAILVIRPPALLREDAFDNGSWTELVVGMALLVLTGAIVAIEGRRHRDLLRSEERRHREVRLEALWGPLDREMTDLVNDAGDLLHLLVWDQGSDPEAASHMYDTVQRRNFSLSISQGGHRVLDQQSDALDAVRRLGQSCNAFASDAWASMSESREPDFEELKKPYLEMHRALNDYRVAWQRHAHGMLEQESDDEVEEEGSPSRPTHMTQR